MFICIDLAHVNNMSSIIVNDKKEIDGKELKQVLHFRFSFEPRFSEVDKSLFHLFSLRPFVLRHVMYTIVDRYDNEFQFFS